MSRSIWGNISLLFVLLLALPMNGFGYTLYGKVLTVGDPTVATYPSLEKALNDITDATLTKRYLIKILPGTYDITTSSSIVVKEFVDIEGSGVGNTALTHAKARPATIILNGNNEIRDVSIYLANVVKGVQDGISAGNNTGVIRLINMYVCLTVTDKNNSLITINNTSENSAFIMDNVRVHVPVTPDQSTGVSLSGMGKFEIKNSTIVLDSPNGSEIKGISSKITNLLTLNNVILDVNFDGQRRDPQRDGIVVLDACNVKTEINNSVLHGNISSGSCFPEPEICVSNSKFFRHSLADGASYNYQVTKKINCFDEKYEAFLLQ